MKEKIKSFLAGFWTKLQGLTWAQRIIIGILGTAVVIVGFILYQRTSLTLALMSARLRTVSAAYYANMPVNDPLVLDFAYPLPPGLIWQYLVDTQQGVAVVPKYDRMTNSLSVRPREGVWPRGSLITIRLKRPESVFLEAVSAVKQIFYPGKKGIFREFSATTAGTFGVVASTMSYGDIRPENGVVIRFNHRLKNPDELLDFLTIDPPVKLKVAEEMTLSRTETGMVFRVTSSDMTYKSQYALTVKTGLEAETGEKLVEPYRLSLRTIVNPNLPQLSFGAAQRDIKLFVVNPGHTRPIPVEAVRTTTYDLKLYDATAAEVINYFVYNQESEEDYWNRKSPYSYSLKGKSVRWQESKRAGDNNDEVILPELPIGVYFLEASSTDSGDPVSAVTVVNVTGMGAVTNAGVYETLFWVSNADTGDPVEDAEIRVYDLSNGASILSSLKTNSDGLVRSDSGEGMDLAVVFRGQDISFIPIWMPGSDISQSENSGGYGWWDPRWTTSAAGAAMRTYIYSDRPIYKPGDTISAKAIIRDDRDGVFSLPTGGNYRLQVERENYDWGQRSTPLVDQAVDVSSFGTAALDLKLPEEMKTGTYYITLRKDDIRLGSQAVIISDYRKPMYHLEVRSDSAVISAGDTAVFNISATYSFGAPARDRQVDWVFYSDPYWPENSGSEDEYGIYNSKRVNNYWLWDSGDYHEKTVTSGKVTLNSLGQAVVEMPVKDLPVGISSRAKFTFEAVLSDEASVPEKASAKIIYSPSKYRLEVLSQNNISGSGSVTVGLFDGSDKLVSQVAVTLKNGESEYTKTTGQDGTVTWPIAKSPSGSQLYFKWQDAQGRQEVRSVYFYLSQSSYKRDTNQVDFSPGIKVASITHPVSPKLGETVDFTVKGGGRKHLVVLERSSVIDTFLVDEATVLPFEIKDKYMPNIYISTYSFVNGQLVAGYSRMEPEDLESFRKIVMTLTPDKGKYAPGETAKISVSTKDSDGNPLSAEVSLAVVDKSIFDLKEKSSFPVHPYFYHKLADRTYYSYNLSGIVVYDWGGRGGGGGGGDQVRDIFADTAFYQPDIVTDANGQASVSFTLPDNLTTWVMSGLGVTQRTDVGEMTGEFVVQKDLFAIPVFPSFVTEGDTVVFGSLVGNNGSADVNVSVSFAFDDRAPDLNPTRTIKLPSGRTEMLYWRMPIGSDLGSRDALVAVNTGPSELADAVRLPIPVEAKGAVIETRASGVGAATYRADLLKGADAKSSKVTVYLTGGILGYISDLLAYQAGYPYGCVEQTMSKFYPTLQVKKYREQLDIGESKLPADLDKMVEAGIARLRKFQHDDGGWGLWTNDASSVFNTSYVLSGLYDLSSAYPVPEDMINKAVAWLSKQYNQSSMSESEKTAALLPLARFSDPAATKIAGVMTSFDTLDDQALAQAVIALAALKDEKTESALNTLLSRAQRTGQTEVSWKTGDNKSYHPHANLTTALAIQAMLDVKPDHEYIPLAINYLNNHKNANVYGSTYTNSQVTNAFIKFALTQGGNNPDLSVEIASDGQIIGTYRLTGSSQQIGPVTVAPEKDIRIVTGGTGSLLWEVRTRNAFIGEVGARETDNYRLQRSYAGGSGENGAIRVGDIVRVTLVAWNKSGSMLANPVISDSIPGGFQIIDSGLDNENSVSQNFDRWTPREVHGSKIALFPWQINSGSSVAVTYYARAFIAGTFTVNPADIRDMYDSAEPAFTATDVISIAAE